MNKSFCLLALLLMSSSVSAQEESTCYQTMDPKVVNQYVPGSAPVIDNLEVAPMSEDSLLVTFSISSVCYPVYFHDKNGARIDSTYSDGQYEIRLQFVRNANGQYPYWFSAGNTRGKTIESGEVNPFSKKQ